MVQSQCERSWLYEPGGAAAGASLRHPTLTELSQQQRDVLDLLLQFKTSNEIAAKLKISSSVVEANVERATSTLNARSRADLALIYTFLREIEIAQAR
jgi:DNA-binding NarL/FixJ family response regulator